MAKNTVLRNALADVVGDDMDSGTLKIFTSADVELVEFALPAAAFPAASTGVITLASVPIEATASAAGTAAKATLAGTLYNITELTVGTSSAHVVIDNAVIASGQIVNLNSLTWTESAGVAAP